MVLVSTYKQQNPVLYNNVVVVCGIIMINSKSIRVWIKLCCVSIILHTISYSNIIIRAFTLASSLTFYYESPNNVL